MDRGIEQPLPPALRGLPIARVFLDVWNELRVEDRFAVVPGIEPAIEIEIRTVDLQIRQSGHALQGVQSVRKEHGMGLLQVLGSAGHELMAPLIMNSRTTLDRFAIIYPHGIRAS